MRRKTHQTIRKVTEDIHDRLHFNTAVAAIMELINMLQFAVEEVQDLPTQHASHGGRRGLRLCSSPFTPHIAEELWQQLGHDDSMLRQLWPPYDPMLTQEDESQSSSRSTAGCAAASRHRRRLPRTTCGEAALRHERIQEWIAGKAIRKVIIVPQKLVNIVVA